MQKYKKVHSFHEVKSTAKLSDMMSSPIPCVSDVAKQNKARARARHLIEDRKFERKMYEL